MGKALILCLLLAGCATTPGSVGNPRQVWCDHNQPRRPSAAVVAAMTRPELDEVNTYNGKGARWCKWKP
jgi:starvation-inducible outer membrane lipoprotein